MRITVCAGLCLGHNFFFFFNTGVWYLAHMHITMIQCVAYIHKLYTCMNLILDLKVIIMGFLKWAHASNMTVLSWCSLHSWCVSFTIRQWVRYFHVLDLWTWVKIIVFLLFIPYLNTKMFHRDTFESSLECIRIILSVCLCVCRFMSRAYFLCSST